MNSSIVLSGLILAAAVEVVAIPIYGALSDRIGRRPIYLFGAIMTAVLAYPTFWMLDTASPVLVRLALLLSLALSHAAMYAPQGAFFSELFGARVRYSGASLGVQLSSVLAGGLSPLIAISFLQHGYGRGALSLYLMGMAIVTIVAVFVASETMHQDMENIGGQATERRETKAEVEARGVHSGLHKVSARYLTAAKLQLPAALKRFRHRYFVRVL